jgi:hypothetical protein
LADIGPARHPSESALKARFLNMPKSRSFMNRLWDWIKEQIVQEVPEDLAVCEFDCRCVLECRKNQCTPRELEMREGVSDNLFKVDTEQWTLGAYGATRK